MTAVTGAVPAAPRPAGQAGRRPGLATARLLRLELRHSPMAGVLPVVIALFWLTTYRKTMAMPPLWNLRAAGLQSGAVLDFAVPVTGAAAWTGSREARRRIAGQLTVTARARWARLMVAWAAATLWALAGYAGCVAVLYAVTAHQASPAGGGGPLWWPAAVGAAAVPAFSALGFAAGTLAPGRFTAPLAAVAAFFVLALSTELIVGSHSYWNVTPLVTGPWDMGQQAGEAAFYPFLPDLPIAQLMLLGGLTLALLGSLALPAGAGGRPVRAAGAALTAAGLLAAATAAALAGTGTMNARGMIAVPALHDAASDRPLPFTPVCAGAPVPVCLNPAYASYLTVTATALQPLLSEIARLPGAPERILQAAVVYQQGAGNEVAAGPPGRGTSPVYPLVLPVQLPGPPVTAAELPGQITGTDGMQIAASFTGDGADASPAQDAVAAALMIDAGPVPGASAGGRAKQRAAAAEGDGPAGPQRMNPDTQAAAERFAALPAPARRAWLAAHLPALRAGRVTLAQLP
jgi:hypothetical protein